MKKKIILVGPVLTRSGYGEQARYALRALRSREDIFDIYVQPLTWGATSWVSEYDEEKLWIDSIIEKTIVHNAQGGQYDVSLQVTIPNEWKSYAPVNIGYTAGIETTKVAHEWISLANSMDKIIVISNHSKNVFESTVYELSHVPPDHPLSDAQVLKTTTDIEAVNYPVKIYESLPEIDLNLKFDTNFLTIAQWSARKNLEHTLKWFVEEFQDDEVGLVIKTNFAKNSLMDREVCEGRLKELIASIPEINKDRKCKVYLLHGDMTDAEMHSLYKHEKISALTAIPHGEGFGLPIFEAAYSGLPVVSVGWSGQLDFLVGEDNKQRFYEVSYDLKPVPKEVVWEGVLIAESAWSYAREHSFKNKMRECYNDIKSNSGHVAKSESYANDLHERFEISKMYEKFIDAMGVEIDAEWANDLSQIEIL